MSIDKSLHVLVVEDNANLRKVLLNIVRKIGFARVSEAENGKDAWELVRDGGVGLVLTDWAMPLMDGIELVSHIRRADPPVRDLPVLMITALDTKDNVITAGQEGVDAYVIKPFSVQTIMDKIEEAVVKRAGSAGA